MTIHGIDEGDFCVMFEKDREESNYLEDSIEDIFQEYSLAKKKLLSEVINSLLGNDIYLPIKNISQRALKWPIPKRNGHFMFYK